MTETAPHRTEPITDHAYPQPVATRPKVSAPVVGHDRVTSVPLCEHGDDAEACQMAHPKAVDRA